MKKPRPGLSRRAVLAGAAAFPLVTILKQPAHAAEFRLKYATGQDPTHPVNIRAQEALDRIREATSGRVEIRLFPRTSSAPTPICWRRCAAARWSSSTSPRSSSPRSCRSRA
jgi:TRAP-type C4-dicarboxylate transport system substrate-binding protein